MSTWTLFVKIWTFCSCEFDANFLSFWGLYYLLFCIETMGILTIIWLILFEKKKSVMAGHLTSGLGLDAKPQIQILKVI